MSLPSFSYNNPNCLITTQNKKRSESFLTDTITMLKHVLNRWLYFVFLSATFSLSLSSIPAHADVSLKEGQYDFKHHAYTLKPDYSIKKVNKKKIDTTTYKTWILENDYLKVTLVPDFGGRILSMVNKTTGHEALYQNPVGTPYLIGRQIFYYDWLMVMGGIFPTFPEPEHGKSWLRQWDFKVIKDTADEVTVAMSYQDNDEYKRHPHNMWVGITNIICTFTITLKKGRAAVDTVVTLENPTDETQLYEYWTNTTLAPGSNPEAPRATEGLQIIAPITKVSHKYGIGANQWAHIKRFKYHNTDGIAYAKPNMQGANFWGAINHDNEEGIFRIADNTLTPGLKIWTFGYDSTLKLDPFKSKNWRRPAIELWAGVTNQFFKKKSFPANSSYGIKAAYTPSVGLKNVTHASDEVLVDLSSEGANLYFLTPSLSYQVQIVHDGVSMVDKTMTPNPAAGNFIPGNFNGNTQLRIYDDKGRNLMAIGN